MHCSTLIDARLLSNTLPVYVNNNHMTVLVATIELLWYYKVLGCMLHGV